MRTVIQMTPSIKVVGSKLPWTTRCDGWSTPVGCPNEIETTVPLTRVGTKSTGWYLCYGQDENGKDDKEFLLAFCPTCAQEVHRQEGQA